MVEKKSYPAAKAASKEKLATSPINDLQKPFFLADPPVTTSERGFIMEIRVSSSLRI
jgi:hypothetical protein